MRSLVALLVLTAGLAHAGDYYVGGGVALAHDNFNMPSGTHAQDTDGVTFLAGYQASPYLAYEAQYQWLEPWDVRSPYPDENGAITSWNVSAAAKVFPCPKVRVSPFLKGGLALVDFDTTDHIRPRVHSWDGEVRDWAFLAGAGVDTPLTDRLTFELAGTYYMPQSDARDMAFYTVGANLIWGF